MAPNWLEPRLSLAQLHLSTGDSNLALEQAERILKAQPTNESALFIKGAVELRKGQLDAPLVSLLQVLKTNPQNAAAYQNLGAAYVVKKNIQKRFGNMKRPSA